MSKDQSTSDRIDSAIVLLQKAKITAKALSATNQQMRREIEAGGSVTITALQAKIQKQGRHIDALNKKLQASQKNERAATSRLNDLRARLNGFRF